MRITQIEYRRLITTGDYSNICVGAHAMLNEGEDAQEAIDALETWVGLELQRRTGREQERAEVRQQIEKAREELRELNATIYEGKRKWAKAKAFLAHHGVDVEREFSDPFGEE